MRIIAGTHRGRTIRMPKIKAVRPTQDRVREAVFNIIQGKVPNSRVLDLYAGSGAFGIEALSRGAQAAIFVDNNKKCIETIKSNLLALGYPIPSAQVFKKEGIRAIMYFGKKGIIFDIIFLDPPYCRGIAKNSLLKIDACDILSQHGFVVCEHFVKDSMPERTEKLGLFKQRRYGDSVVSIYKNHE